MQKGNNRRARVPEYLSFDTKVNRLSDLLVSVVRNAAFTNAISSVGRDMGQLRFRNAEIHNFWIVAHNNALDMAVIDWCKIFGSQSTNPTHWTYTFEQKKHAEIREAIHNAVGGEEQWKAIQGHIVNFRNTQAAHHEYEAPTNFNHRFVPKLAPIVDTSVVMNRAICNAYDVHDDGVFEGGLKGYYDKLLTQVTVDIATAMTAGMT